jgi:hypothetical protein
MRHGWRDRRVIRRGRCRRSGGWTTRCGPRPRRCWDGGARAEEVRRLNALDKENRRLKEILANLDLDKKILKEALEGNY